MRFSQCFVLLHSLFWALRILLWMFRINASRTCLLLLLAVAVVAPSVTRGPGQIPLRLR